MSLCFFISSNSPLKEVIADNAINLDKPEENDVSIYRMSFYKDEYSGMNYANEIEYSAVCSTQVQQILDYINSVMIEADIVELWRVWISDYGVPIVRTQEVSINNLTSEYLYSYLAELEKAPRFNQPLHEADAERPIYYRLRICKGL